jgi:catechol 2,3-dioxygenase-like lactoylglutathione lyase family enzyme
MTAVEFAGVGNVFYFVDDLEAAVDWYGARLKRQPVVRGEALAAFDLDGTRLTLHRKDEFNTPGPAGTSRTGRCSTSMLSPRSGPPTAL